LGVLRFDGENLVLEFQTKDGMFEMLLSDIRRVTLPLPALTAFTWKPGWLGGAFDLSVATLELTRDLPGSDQGCVHLKVKRKDRPAAEHLANEVELAQANRVLHRIAAKHTRSGEAGATGCTADTDSA
jgi:hypothetical protein